MPAESKRQQRFFGWLDHNPEARAAHGISKKVTHEFAHAPGGTTKGLPERKKKRHHDEPSFGSLHGAGHFMTTVNPASAASGGY